MSSISRTQLVKNVTTAGTAVPVSATSLGYAEVTIQAKKGNTGYIYVGDSSVSDSVYGVALSAGASVTLQGGDFNDIYIDSDTNGEGVTALYTEV